MYISALNNFMNALNVQKNYNFISSMERNKEADINALRYEQQCEDYIKKQWPEKRSADAFSNCHILPDELFEKSRRNEQVNFCWSKTGL